MNAQDPIEIEELVAETLARIEEEGPGALEEVCRARPESAEALRLRVEWLLDTHLARVGAREPRDYPERLGDFRLIEPIGQGGMGVVYRAEQVSLGRVVALKLVRPEQLYFPGALDRFQREVTTIAALAHPGIVPVFAVGQEEGVPFFAMEHVRGASLGAVIGSLEGRRSRDLTGADLLRALDELGAGSDEEPSSLFDGPWPAVCARVAREVAEALEHAHRRGVLHRDVKPSNVMLTRGGRVMLVDFGLSSYQSVHDRRTKTGHRVGTLAYMPPEQLRGERELDARADVFALGVTLYELLSLKLPYDASSEAERLSQAGLTVPSDLRKLDPRISWELETVVQTAADPDPGRRYDSAGDLARDLDNVLENRPIEARRSSPLLRARRWAQRHPAAALAALVVVAGPSLFALQAVRANAALSRKGVELQDSNAALGKALEEANRQRVAAETERKRAERNFERAYEAVELMLGRVGGEVLEGIPRVEPIRRELLQDALRLNEELLSDPAADHAQTRSYARTLRRTAALRAELGQLSEAMEALDEEADVRDALPDGSSLPELVRERGLLDSRRGEVSKLLGDHAQARAYGQLAVERLARLAGEAPEPGTLWALARARLELADVLTRDRHRDEAHDQLVEATAVLHALTDEGRGTWEQRQTLAEALHLSAGHPASSLAGDLAGYDPAAGEGFLREALAVRRTLVAERPDDALGLYGLARSAMVLGNTLGAMGRFPEAEDSYREALEAYERLEDEFPARPVYADGLAATRLDLSLIVAARGRAGERERLLEQAVAGYEELAGAEQNPVYRRNLAFALGQLGHAVHVSRADPERADRLLSRSLEVGLPIWAEQRGDGDLRTAQAWTVGILGTGRLRQGDARGAVAAARIYLELEPRPVELVWAANFLAGAVALGRAGDVAPDELAEWTDEALTLLERGCELAPRDREVQQEAADPGFAAIADEPRYQAVLEALSGS